MAFYVDFPQRDREYLQGSLSAHAFERLMAQIAETLENCSAPFREERRLSPPPGNGSPATLFELRHVLLDAEQIHVVRFVVNDSTAAYGVLKVIYVDIQSSPFPAM